MAPAHLVVVMSAALLALLLFLQLTRSLAEVADWRLNLSTFPLAHPQDEAPTSSQQYLLGVGKADITG